MKSRRRAPAAVLSALLVLPLTLIGATPAAAATIEVFDEIELREAFNAPGVNNVIVLGVNISAYGDFKMHPTSTLVLDLNGRELFVQAGLDGEPGLGVPAGATLTIVDYVGGFGTLEVYGGTNAAGIGGGQGEDAGTITITGVRVLAFGGNNAAGIGGGVGGAGGTVTIMGGYVSGYGGANAAGIGGGQGGAGGTVTITGAYTLVGAVGATNAAGIGGGQGGAAGVLEIFGIPEPGAATTGAGPQGSPITNPSLIDCTYTADTYIDENYDRAAIDINIVGNPCGPRSVFVVDFDSLGGSSVPEESVSSHRTATEPADPTRDGFTFGGWTLDGVPYDFSAPVTESLTLVAVWTPIPVEAPGGVPGLAETGADANGLAAIAVGLLAAGIMLAVVARPSLRRRGSVWGNA